MDNTKRGPILVFIVMTVMAVASFTNLFGLSLSSAAIILGLVFFFVSKILEKQPMKGSGLDFRAIGANLKDKKIWVWIALPIFMDTICVALSIWFFPGYIEYETARAGSFVPIDLSVSSVLLFFVFALGEEIAWRAFFQKRLSKILPTVPVLLITSFLFTLGHYQKGNAVIVLFGLVFTFINSVLYGVIFHKTKNAWVSAISHFAANIFGVMLFIIV